MQYRFFFRFVLAAALMMAGASACQAQAPCTYSFNPQAATLVADPAYDDGTVTFTVIASAPSCVYGIFVPMEPDYDVPENTPLNIQPGTQTYTLTNEYPPGGCCTSQANIVVGAFGPISLYGVYPAFSGSIAILPVTDPADPSTNPSSLLATTTSVPNSVNGQPYAPFQLQASGGTPPYTWICHGCDGESSDGNSDTPLVIDSAGNVTSSTTFANDPNALQITQQYPVLFSISVDLKDAAGTDVPLVVSFANYPAGYLTPSLPAAPTMLDPTPLALTDPKQSLMSVDAAGNVGTSVTTDPTQLAKGGRPVQGIAADGTAEIVLRIPVQSTKDTVTVTVLSDQCSIATTPSSCAVSTNADYDGGLLTLSNGSSPIVAGASQMATGDANNFAYLIYRAPLDFVRYPGFPVDPSLTTRPVTFEVQYTSATGTPYGVQYIPLSIVRPPTILIHGYAAASADTWELFTPVTSNTLTKVYKVDYSAPVKVASTTPALCNSILCLTNFRQSDFGFKYNTPRVAMQIVVDLRDFASGDSPIQEPVAVSQIDVVAHSMGGLIARYWTTSPDQAAYKTPTNYGQGYIHKLITLGTPLYGSPFATEGLSPNAGCFRDRSAYVHRYEIGTAILPDGKSVINGAVGELDGDGIGLRLNLSLQAIQNSSIKVHSYLIAGEIGPVSGYTQLIHVACLNFITPDPVASRMTPALYNTLFYPNLTPATEAVPGSPEVNDGVVPLSSALYSFGGAMASSCTMDGNQCLSGDAHGGGTAELVGASKFLVDADAATIVEQILNTSLSDSSVWITR